MAGKGAAGGREVVIGRFMACKVVSAKVVRVSLFYWRQDVIAGGDGMGVVGCLACERERASVTSLGIGACVGCSKMSRRSIFGFRGGNGRERLEGTLRTHG